MVEKQRGIAQFLVLGLMALGLVAVGIAGKSIQNSQDTRSSAAFVETSSSYCCQGSCDPSRNQCETVAGSCPAGWTMCLSTGTTGVSVPKPTIDPGSIGGNPIPTGSGVGRSEINWPTPSPSVGGGSSSGSMPLCDVSRSGSTFYNTMDSCLYRCDAYGDRSGTWTQVSCGGTGGGIVPTGTGGTKATWISPTPVPSKVPNPTGYDARPPCDVTRAGATYFNNQNGCTYRCEAEGGWRELFCNGGGGIVPTGVGITTGVVRITVTPTPSKMPYPTSYGPSPTPVAFATVAPRCNVVVQSFESQAGNCTNGLAMQAVGRCNNGREFTIAAKYGCEDLQSLRNSADAFCMNTCFGGINLTPPPTYVTPTPAQITNSCGVRNAVFATNGCGEGQVSSVKGVCNSGRPFEFNPEAGVNCGSYMSVKAKAEAFCNIGCGVSTVRVTPTLAPTATPTVSKRKVEVGALQELSCKTCPSGVPAFSLGNANCDGKIDMNDRLVWMSEYTNYMKTKKVSDVADFNCDKKTDTADYVIWSKNQKVNLNY